MNIYEAKYLIVDHFDEIINKIDIRVETLLSSKTHFQDKDRNVINEIREKQIEIVKEFQHESVSNIIEKNYESKFSHILNDASQTHTHVIEAVLCEFIENDLMLIDEANSKTKQALCILPAFFCSIDKQMIK